MDTVLYRWLVLFFLAAHAVLLVAAAVFLRSAVTQMSQVMRAQQDTIRILSERLVHSGG